MKCPKCKSENGFYSKGTFIQYYDSDLDPEGYGSKTEGNMLYCCNCHSRFKEKTLIKSLKRSDNNDTD